APTEDDDGLADQFRYAHSRRGDAIARVDAQSALGPARGSTARVGAGHLDLHSQFEAVGEGDRREQTLSPQSPLVNGLCHRGNAVDQFAWYQSWYHECFGRGSRGAPTCRKPASRAGFRVVGAARFELATFRPPAERELMQMRPWASITSTSSTVVDRLDASDVV